MTRVCAVLAALVAALFCAPAAFAATWVVNDNGDAPRDPAAIGCDTDADINTPPVCTLRAAIETANLDAAADTITFAANGRAPAPVAPLPKVTQQLTIDGGGNTTVSFSPTAGSTLIDVGAPDSTIKSITLQGGAGGTLVNLGVSGDRLDTVTAQAPGTVVRLSGSSTRVDGSKVTSTNGTGIVVVGSSVTVSNTSVTASGPGIDIPGSGASIVAPEISGGGSDGIRISGSSVSVNGGHIHGNAGNGVTNSGGTNSITRVVFYANGGKPIANAPGANGGIQPPQNVRIGPRRADGTLPLTGTGSAGTIELWRGDPSSPNAPGFVDAFSSSGDFTYNFASEPQPGTVFALGLTASNLGTAEFVTVAVPDDVVSPDVTFARALDTNNVRVDFSEPIDPATVGTDDFHLSMAGADRTITSVTAGADNRSVTLASSGWKAGEAGTVEVTGVGAVTDSAGNAMLTAPRLRVAAAPGDFVAPLGGKLRISPTSICLTHSRKCRHTGMTIKFATTEAGKGRLVIKRGDKTVGTRLYGNIVPGTNSLKWNGRLGSRKLRAGRYRLLMYVQDPVGNITDQPPIVLFNVRRVTP